MKHHYAQIPRVLEAKGKLSSRIIAGPGKDNITIPAGVHASGGKFPPLVIFKGNNVWSSLIPDKSETTFKYMSFCSNGWMASEIFRNYFMRSFIPQEAGEKPIPVIYDGHASQVDNALIESARNHNINVLKLPAHSSHLLQSFDLAVFRSFKAIWDRKLTVNTTLEQNENDEREETALGQNENDKSEKRPEVHDDAGLKKPFF